MTAKRTQPAMCSRMPTTASSRRPTNPGDPPAIVKERRMCACERERDRGGKKGGKRGRKEREEGDKLGEREREREEERAGERKKQIRRVRACSVREEGDKERKEKKGPRGEE